MNTAQPLAAAPNPNRPLWAAVTVLGVAVLAMGASLVYILTRPPEPNLALVASPAPVVVATSPASAPLPVASLPAAAAPTSPAKPVTAKKTVQPLRSTPAPVSGSTRPYPGAAPAPALVTAAPATNGASPVNAPPPKVVCANCGTVEAVTPIQRDGTGTGVGTVAGGVLGAVVGNQVGSGDGKTLATILGAVGGGFAGNAVEKKMKKETLYQVRVHMDDGSTRNLEQATPPAVGARVQLDGNTLQPLAH